MLEIDYLGITSVKLENLVEIFRRYVGCGGTLSRQLFAVSDLGRMWEKWRRTKLLAAMGYTISIHFEKNCIFF